MPEGSLGRGLDALIKKSTPKKKKEKKTDKTKQETIIKEVSKSKKEINTSISLDDDKIDQIIQEVEKNPRISLWSAKSAAVLRYLKKTTPEFSISNEASSILEEAIQNKYPEIWELFEDL